MSQFYLYRHIRPDLNIPFYIGIGKVQNKNWHNGSYKRAFDFGLRSSLWTNIFSKVKTIDVEIMLESNDYDEIKEKEKEFIKLYGRIDKGTGPLCNFTDGGEGTLGLLKSPETRQKMSLKKKSDPKYLEVIKKLAIFNTGRKQSKEHIEKSRLARTGLKRSEEAKVKTAIKHKGMKRSPEFCAGVSKFLTGRKKGPMSAVTKDKLRTANSKPKTSPKQIEQIIKNSQPVGQYDMNGLLLNKFRSYNAAALSVYGDDDKVRLCANGERKTHKGFIWKRI